MGEKVDTKEYCVECFKSLGVPAKYKIFVHLRDNGETTVGSLVELVGLTQPTVSYHLKGMQQHGLLTSRKAGKEVYYSVNLMCPNYNKFCLLNNVGL